MCQDFNLHTKRQKATEYHFDLGFTFYSIYSSYSHLQRAKWAPEEVSSPQWGTGVKREAGRAPQAQPALQESKTTRVPLRAQRDLSLTWTGFLESPFSHCEMNVECNELLEDSRATSNTGPRLTNGQKVSVNRYTDIRRRVCDIEQKDAWTSSDILCHSLVKVLQRLHSRQHPESPCASAPP